MNLKLCSKCRRALEFHYFSKDTKANDNCQRWCKNCMAKYKSAHQHTRVEYNSKYYRTKKYKELSKQRYSNKSKLQHRAQGLLRLAVEHGIILKPTICSQCCGKFSLDKIQGHHINYNNPYHVQWVCQKCHTSLHKEC